MKMTWHVLVVLLCVFSELSSRPTENKCYEEDFYIPYAHLYRTRRSPNALHEFQPSEFVDLSGYIDHYMCINGVAIRYADVIYEDEMNTVRKMSKMSDDDSEEEETATEEVSSVPDILKKINEEVEGILKIAGTDDEEYEYHIKVLDDNLLELVTTEKFIADNDSSSKALADEIKIKIEKARFELNPMPKLLDKILSTITLAKETIDEQTKGEDPSSKILESAISEIRNTKTTFETCGKEISNKSLNCESSLDALANVVSVMTMAKDSIDTINSNQSADSSVDLQNPASLLLGKFIAQATSTKEMLSNITVHGSNDSYSSLATNFTKEDENFNATMEDSSNKTVAADPSVEVLNNEIKEFMDAKVTIDELSLDRDNTSLAKSSSNMEIVKNILSKIEDAKNKIQTCGRFNETCKSSAILHTLGHDLSVIKVAIEQQEEAELLSNPLSVLLAKGIYQISLAKQAVEIEALKDNENPSSNDEGKAAGEKIRRRRSASTKNAKNTKNTTRPIAIFKDGYLAVYSHACFVINYVPRRVFMASRSRKVEMRLTRALETVGNKVMGFSKFLA